MPQATLAAVADHGTIRGDTIRPLYTEAHQVLRELAAVGVDYDDVVDLLEHEGLTKFEESWALVTDELSDRLRGTSPHPEAENSLPRNKDHS
jgi:transaldolase